MGSICSWKVGAYFKVYRVVHGLGATKNNMKHEDSYVAGDVLKILTRSWSYDSPATPTKKKTLSQRSRSTEKNIYTTPPNDRHFNFIVNNEHLLSQQIINV